MPLLPTDSYIRGIPTFIAADNPLAPAALSSWVASPTLSAMPLTLPDQVSAREIGNSGSLQLDSPKTRVQVIGRCHEDAREGQDREESQ